MKNRKKTTNAVTDGIYDLGVRRSNKHGMYLPASMGTDI